MYHNDCELNKFDNKKNSNNLGKCMRKEISIKFRVGIRALRHCRKCALRMAFEHGLIKWLPGAHACSDQVQNLFAAAKLSFLFSCALSQITPSMQNGHALMLLVPVLVCILQLISALVMCYFHLLFP